MYAGNMMKLGCRWHLKWTLISYFLGCVQRLSADSPIHGALLRFTNDHLSACGRRVPPRSRALSGASVSNVSCECSDIYCLDTTFLFIQRKIILCSEEAISRAMSLFARAFTKTTAPFYLRGTWYVCGRGHFIWSDSVNQLDISRFEEYLLVILYLSRLHWYCLRVPLLCLSIRLRPRRRSDFSVFSSNLGTENWKEWRCLIG